MLPVLDGHVEAVPALVQIGDDRFAGPVAVAVDDVAAIAVLQQLGVVTLVRRPLAQDVREMHAPQANPKTKRNAIWFPCSRLETRWRKAPASLLGGRVPHRLR